MANSRYNIATMDKPDFKLVVLGWDAPMCTFFFQVWKEDDEDDEEPLHWCGDKPGEIATVEQLQIKVAPYMEIPPEILEKLQRDYDEPWSPSPLQQESRKFFEELSEL